jgi:hypothetical protein
MSTTFRRTIVLQKTVKGEDGNYRIQGLEGVLPMMYTIKAVK